MSTKVGRNRDAYVAWGLAAVSLVLTAAISVLHLQNKPSNNLVYEKEYLQALGVGLTGLLFCWLPGLVIGVVASLGRGRWHRPFVLAAVLPALPAYIMGWVVDSTIVQPTIDRQVAERLGIFVQQLPDYPDIQSRAVVSTRLILGPLMECVVYQTEVEPGAVMDFYLSLFKGRGWYTDISTRVADTEIRAVPSRNSPRPMLRVHVPALAMRRYPVGVYEVSVCGPA
jgi:hypothetical protein